MTGTANTQTRIKICGITSLADALTIASLGADALGFVFYPQSPRYVEPETVRNIIAALPPFVTTVGLFVNHAPAEILRIMQHTGLDAVQLHGDETPEQCVLPEYRVVKALRVKDAASLQGAERYPVSALLLDAWRDEEYGGTGHQFDWELARRYSAARPLILAGGLRPDNVATAIRTVRPYAVDVSSGVELSPGKKDMKKVEDFITQVRNI